MRHKLDLFQLPAPSNEPVPPFFQIPYPIIGNDRLYQEGLSPEEKALEPRGNIMTSNKQICVNDLLRKAFFGTATTEGRSGIEKINRIRKTIASDVDLDYIWWKHELRIKGFFIFACGVLVVCILFFLMSKEERI